ncbi:MAG: hypothetical protein Q4G57_02590, partial [Bacillota bacterium]|nr:hypothetical protein [Bacillota bacterium]
MSTEKKPTATVKASFISTKTEDTKVPAKKEEKKVVKKAEKKAVALYAIIFAKGVFMTADY